MNDVLQRVRISGLHGTKTIEVEIQNDTLVLVGENGSGKTTFLRILFHILSGRWLPLAQFKFDVIEVVVAGRTYTIEHETLWRAFSKLDRRFLSELPPSVRSRMISLLQSGDTELAMSELRRVSARYGISVDLAIRQLNLFENQPSGLGKETAQQIQEIVKAIDAQVLYLPTYRRIERELSSIFEGIDHDDVRRTRSPRPSASDPEREAAFIELVEFGMQDVQRAISRSLDGLREFARQGLNSLTVEYLGDVVNRAYNNVAMDELARTTDETVSSVLDRIHESVLSTPHKGLVLSAIAAARSSKQLDEHSRIICHYFLKLLAFQESLKSKERSVSAFCDLCSDYVANKRFVYNAADFSFSIVASEKRGGMLELGDLSSGEKQIVSLFSHLYLSGNRRFYVLIDEPELSLSVPWQRRFLTDIRDGSFCAGLVAVTHSPFIYDNELRQSTRSLGEFIFRQG